MVAVGTGTEDIAFTAGLVAYVAGIVMAIIGDSVSGALTSVLETCASVASDLVVANAKEFTLEIKLLEILRRTRDGGI